MSQEVADVKDCLTEGQRLFLAQCEEEFADRFTDNDEAFKKVKDSNDSSPPIIDPWYCHSNRNFDWDGNRDRDNYRGKFRYDRQQNRGRYRPYRYENHEYNRRNY